MANEDGETTGLEALFEQAQNSIAAATTTEEFDQVPNLIRSVIPDGYHEEFIDLQKYQDAPRRKTGTAEFDRVGSLIEYVNRHRSAATEAYVSGETFVVVLNSDESGPNGGEGVGPGSPGWGDHVARFTLKPTRSWAAWRAQDGKPMTQEAFAEFLEDRIPDVADPAGGVLMDIATNLRVKNNVNFQSSIRMANGAVQFTYEDNVQATAGEKGDLKVPELLTLSIIPYEDGGPRKAIAARFRWRIVSGKASFFFALGDAIQEVTDNAIADAVEVFEDATTLTVLYGKRDFRADASQRAAHGVN